MNQYSTLIGIIVAFGLVVLSILMGDGGIGGYIDPGSVLIVVGGSIGTSLMVFNIDKLKNLVAILKIAFLKSDTDKVEEVYQIIRLANKARKNGGLLGIQDDINNLEDPFLRKGLNLVIDNTDPEILKLILLKEIDSTASRHQNGQDIFTYLGDAAPAFGKF